MVQNNHPTKITRTYSTDKNTENVKTASFTRKTANKAKEPLNFGRDFLNKTIRPHKIQEVKITNFIQRKILNPEYFNQDKKIHAHKSKGIAISYMAEQ